MQNHRFLSGCLYGFLFLFKKKKKFFFLKLNENPCKHPAGKPGLYNIKASRSMVSLGACGQVPGWHPPAHVAKLLTPCDCQAQRLRSRAEAVVGGPDRTSAQHVGTDSVKARKPRPGQGPASHSSQDRGRAQAGHGPAPRRSPRAPEAPKA